MARMKGRLAPRMLTGPMWPDVAASASADPPAFASTDPTGPLKPKPASGQSEDRRHPALGGTAVVWPPGRVQSAVEAQA